MSDLRYVSVNGWNINTSLANGSAGPFVISSHGRHLLPLVDYFNELRNLVEEENMPRLTGPVGEEMGTIKSACLSV